MVAVFLAALRGRQSPWVSAAPAVCREGSGDAELLSILVAEEDPALSQDQLEITAKAGIVKCDKLME